MPVSTTSFQERVQRINNGMTIESAEKKRRYKKRRTIRDRCATFPFLVGLSILAGGTAYAYISTEPDMQWVLALAG